jgi:hypothetical protein
MTLIMPIVDADPFRVGSSESRQSRVTCTISLNLKQHTKESYLESIRHNSEKNSPAYTKIKD